MHMKNNLRIFKKYGILVLDDDGLVRRLKRIPNRKTGETFKQWKKRIFGEDVEGLMVYAPYEPSPNTRMSTLAKEGGSTYLIRVLKNYRLMAEGEAEEALEEAREKLNEKFNTVPMELLEEIFEENKKKLETPVVDFLKRYIERGERNVSTREILSGLIKTYNKAVSEYRKAYSEYKRYEDLYRGLLRDQNKSR